MLGVNSCLLWTRHITISQAILAICLQQEEEMRGKARRENGRRHRDLRACNLLLLICLVRMSILHREKHGQTCDMQEEALVHRFSEIQLAFLIDLSCLQSMRMYKYVSEGSDGVCTHEM
jgi:hypothetical protein